MKSRTYTGINIQWPISEEITSGRKTIETRTYALPEKFLNQEMLLIETPGKSQAFKSRIVAIIKFVSSTEYKSKTEFYKDVSKHLVDKNSPWAWKDKKKYGWGVKVIKTFSPPIEFKGKKGIVYTKNISVDHWN
ncbi:hypothetical protein [Peredibacter starrii]|uniref:ASCH domain-containing protein n=1 Tax=Peredibacter starrii TaxID=28202 RepID=A0AAX4HS66_9BACT|nr:hypothetical protein [Peredibacter starrii]WPU65896.1 hypothetical protein SOO65_03975 [Peredibacter starrii]